MKMKESEVKGIRNILILFVVDLNEWKCCCWWFWFLVIWFDLIKEIEVEVTRKEWTNKLENGNLTTL